MPWKELTSLWTEAYQTNGDSHFRGLDNQDKAVIVEMPKPLPDNRAARLTFPCGGSIDGAPLWQRNSGVESRGILAAFKVHDKAAQDWNKTKTETYSAVRQNPRADMRLWVGFPELERQGTVTRDISLEGCRLKGDFRGHLDGKLKIYLDLPDALAPLRLDALVSWANPTEAGLRFVNIHSQDEVRLLRTLGMATVPASSFVPGADITSPSFTYQASTEGTETKLLLTVANWDVSFTFENAQIEGSRLGAFQRFETPISSDSILEYRAQAQVSLSRKCSVLCLRLFDQEDQLLFQIVGEETGFKREKRAPVVGERELNSSS